MHTFVNTKTTLHEWYRIERNSGVHNCLNDHHLNQLFVCFVISQFVFATIDQGHIVTLSPALIHALCTRQTIQCTCTGIGPHWSDVVGFQPPQGLFALPMIKATLFYDSNKATTSIQKLFFFNTSTKAALASQSHLPLFPHDSWNHYY